MECFSNKHHYEKQKAKEDYNFAMAFGLGFISLTFMGFLTGYCIGKFVMVKDDEFSLILSLVTGIFTLILEMSLMICRLTKFDNK